MNEEIVRNAFHIMELKVTQIASRYLLSKQILESKENKLCSGDDDSNAAFRVYVARVEDAYNALDESQKYIINNDFFYQQSNAFWWEECYSKSTYYRLKKAAMRKFLRTFANA